MSKRNKSSLKLALFNMDVGRKIYFYYGGTSICKIESSIMFIYIYIFKTKG